MYTLTYSLALGSAYAATSDLRAQLIDTAGVDVGVEISTGFVNVGSGYHMWTCTSIPDGHRGGVKFYSDANPLDILGFSSINPQEAEYVDAKVSEVSGGGSVDVNEIVDAIMGAVIFGNKTVEDVLRCLYKKICRCF